MEQPTHLHFYHSDENLTNKKPKKGPTGPPGARGATGVAGVAGGAGATGVAGVAGATGATGVATIQFDSSANGQPVYYNSTSMEFVYKNDTRDIITSTLVTYTQGPTGVVVPSGAKQVRITNIGGGGNGGSGGYGIGSSMGGSGGGGGSGGCGGIGTYTYNCIGQTTINVNLVSTLSLLGINNISISVVQLIPTDILYPYTFDNGNLVSMYGNPGSNGADGAQISLGAALGAPSGETGQSAGGIRGLSGTVYGPIGTIINPAIHGNYGGAGANGVIIPENGYGLNGGTGNLETDGGEAIYTKGGGGGGGYNFGGIYGIGGNSGGGTLEFLPGSNGGNGNGYGIGGGGGGGGGYEDESETVYPGGTGGMGGPPAVLFQWMY